MNQPRLIVDFRHPAHINFFKPAIYVLKREGWEIELIAIDRGKVVRITQEEFPEFKIHTIGKHRGTKFSILFEANLLRFVEMLGFVMTQKFDIAISVSSFILGAACKLKGIPNLQFYDDPEYKKHVRLQKLTSTKTFYPRIKEFGPEIETFNALKEWAYLSPKYFTPNENILSEYGLMAGKYIFVREVINASLNYEDQKANIISTFADSFPENYQVVLSLENKKTKDLYPSNWIILKEPVSDIHSLIYFSRLSVSSGDSMAREAAMLGVPSIYCGIREMKANQLLIDKYRLFHIMPKDSPDFIDKIINNDIKLSSQEEFILSLNNEWEDVTQFIINKVKKYAKQ